MSSKMWRKYMLFLLHVSSPHMGLTLHCGVHLRVKGRTHATKTGEDTFNENSIYHLKNVSYNSCKSDRWQIIIIG